jgi:DedD protein
MDPALKQRLIGATVLVVLAVIFVPMLIDDTPRSDSEAIDLSMPGAPKQNFETQIVPLGTPGPDATLPIANPDQVATVDTNAPARVDALGGDEPQVAPPVATAPPASAPAATPRTVAPPPAATTAPDVQTPVPPVAAIPTPARLPQPAAGGRHLVQFGSYARSENAQALVAELGRAGIRAETERVEVDGKSALRVRSGPYVDRTSAERVRVAARQVRPDVPSSLTEIDVAPRSEVRAADAAGRVTGWAVQVGALADPADASALRDRLRSGGFTAYVETLRTEGGTLYRVRVGPEIQRANAERLRDTLKSRFALDGQVVTHP